METLSVHRALSGDILKLKKMIDDLNRYHQCDSKTNIHKLQKFCFVPNMTKAYILRSGKNMIGFSIGYDWINYVQDMRVHHIDLFYICEKWRGQEYGAFLLNAVIQKAKRRGCDRVDVTASVYNKGANRFYKQNGFLLRKRQSNLYQYNVI